MKQDTLSQLLDNIPVTKKNSKIIEQIKEDLAKKDYASALQKIEMLSPNKKVNISEKQEEEEDSIEIAQEEDIQGMFPKKLSDIDLERQYIGLLLTDPRLIIKYFYLYEECYFEDPELLNIYKSIIFTEGGAYSSEKEFQLCKRQ